MKLIKTLAALGLGALAFNATANQAKAAPCGYWTWIDVEVCDERQIEVRTPITQCKYIVLGAEPILDPDRNYEVTHTYDGHRSCPTEISNNGVLIQQVQTHRVTYETERYNCRIESQRVWIPVSGGKFCSIEP